MLALRLVRGAHPLVQLRRLLVATAAAGVGFLLLCALGYAVGHPARSSDAALRLLWCLPPLVATTQLAVAVARTDPSTRPRPGLSAIGLGPARLTAVAATSTAVSCTLGSLLALLLFLHLRGDITGLPFDGAASGLLAAGKPMPLAAALTLLALVPLTAATAAGLALRPNRPVPPATGRSATAQLPWGVALLTGGLAVETYAARGDDGGVFIGWFLTAIGLAMTGPALVHGCGRLLQTLRPGAVRLLAGRVLMTEALRVGRPLGILSAVGSAGVAAAAYYGGAAFGPLTWLGAVVVVGCTTATLVTAALESRRSRARTTAALLRLGAPPSMLRTTALLRAGVLLAVFVPLTWLVGTLAAAPLRR
ncbi:hypothetical protein ACGFRB_10430 [Streptomyces sp. NPDC048718]|uniref:hypothetical protein n=1 Tax=Streptomyces sp. NPDC048718 TaxID=3365587 RepID=UPI003720FE3C